MAEKAEPNETTGRPVAEPRGYTRGEVLQRLSKLLEAAKRRREAELLLKAEERAAVQRDRSRRNKLQAAQFQAWAADPAAPPIEFDVAPLPGFLETVSLAPVPPSAESVIRLEMPYMKEVFEIRPAETGRLIHGVAGAFSRSSSYGDWQARASWDMPGSHTSFGAGLMPASIYLADADIAAEVEDAVESWLENAGLVVEERERPVIGSWFRSLSVGVKQAVHSGAIQDAALTAVHAADNRLVLYQDAQTTALLLQNLGPVIASLQPTKDAVVRAGALLIVKVDWQLQVFQLTAAQQAVLDHRPRLAAAPGEIIQALQLSQPEDGQEVPAAE
jgi:hypothetical protein